MENIKEIFVVADKILVKNSSHFFVIGFEHIMGWYEWAFTLHFESSESQTSDHFHLEADDSSDLEQYLPHF